MVYLEVALPSRAKVFGQCVLEDLWDGREDGCRSVDVGSPAHVGVGAGSVVDAYPGVHVGRPCGRVG